MWANVWNSISLTITINVALIILPGNAEAQVSPPSGIFTVLAHRTLLPSSNYTVWVSGNPSKLDPSSPPPPLMIYIDCQGNRTLNVNNRLTIGVFRLRAGESGSGTIQTEKSLVLEHHNYCDLMVLHADTLNVIERSRLELTSPKHETFAEIFFQMDKPVYKPGDKLRIRIVLLDKNSIPDPTAQFKVTLQNPYGIVMNQWPSGNNLNKLRIDPNGLLTLKFQLAKELNLGEWKIIVETKSSKKEKPFLVEKYVMPKFFLKFTTTPKSYLTPQTSSFTTEIHGSYTYGKDLVGNVSVALFNIKNPKQRISRTAILHKGQAYVQMDAATLGQPLVNGMTLKMEVNATEDSTGRVQSGSHTIQVYNTDPYKITWLNPQTIFKPDVQFIIKVAVSDFDNIPVSDFTRTAITLTSTFGNQMKQILRSEIPRNGLVTFSLKAPSTGETFQSISIKYKTKILNLPVPKHFQSRMSERFTFNIEPLDEDDDFIRGENITLFLRASATILTTVNYVLTSGIEIIDFKSGQSVTSDGLPSSQGSLNVFLPPFPKIYSELKIVVYFVYGDERGTIISAGYTIPTNNRLAMSLSKSRVEPAQNVSLTFHTHPGSTIAIRGIDQSILLLSQDKDNNDVDPRSVPFNPYAIQKSPLLHEMSTNSDFYGEFASASLLILTNGYIGEKISRAKRDTSMTTARNKRSVNIWKNSDNTYHPLLSELAFYEGPVRTRIHFPETWMWEELTATQVTTIHKKNVPIVPDTMTSWYVTAMSINKHSGFAVTPRPKILTVFRPFFITLDLPYSVIKGEIFELRVIVHNYLGQDAPTTITFMNDLDNFQFVDTREQRELNITRQVVVKNEEVDVVSFIITPLAMGFLPLNIRALTDVAGDAISRTLRVDLPGKKQWKSQDTIVFYGTDSNSTKTHIITPSRRRRDTTTTHKLSVSTNPGQSGKVLANHDKVTSLIQLPSGCGEQNMVGFVPNILALDFLQSLKKLDKETEEQISKNLLMGYQSQMQYFKPDGSFQYHTSDGQVTTWLTAFILRCFTDASMYIPIDKRNVIIKGLNFLLKQQNKGTGEFYENGKLIYFEQELKGGLAGRGRPSAKYGISAYVTLALIEISNAMSDVLTRAEKISLDAAEIQGLKFISSESSLMDSDPYSLVIVTCTLHAARHSSSQLFFEKMEKLAKTKNTGTENELKWWEFNVANPETIVTAMSVEMTGYALMTYMWRPESPASKSLPIVKWLLNQRTMGGGFKSTQDTVVALTALSKFATRAMFLEGKNEVDILIRTNDNYTYEIKVNEDNSLVVHDLFLPINSESYEITTRGIGRVYMAFSEGHLTDNLVRKEENFKIVGQLTGIPDKRDMYNFHFCVHYESQLNTNGQVLAIIKLPSGYIFENKEAQEYLNNLGKTRGNLNVSKLQVKDQGTEVNIYYDHLTKTPSCLNLEVYQHILVVSKNDGHVTVTDYYNPTIESAVYIDADKKSTVCQLCIKTNGCDVISGCLTTR